jgi:hypothetical protein
VNFTGGELGDALLPTPGGYGDLDQVCLSPFACSVQIVLDSAPYWERPALTLTDRRVTGTTSTSFVETGG